MSSSSATAILLAVSAVALLEPRNAAAPVSSQLRFTVEPEDTVVQSGRSARLFCSAQFLADKSDSSAPSSSSSSELSIQWMKDGEYMTLDPGSRRRQLEDGSLEFEAILHSRTHRPDEGQYQCVAFARGVGTIVSRKARLTVAYLAESFAEEPLSMTLHLGDTALLPCHVIGRPEPTVSWYKDEQKLAPDAQHSVIPGRRGVLQVKDVQFANFGEYRCRASNTAGSVSSQTVTLRQNADVGTYRGVSPTMSMKPTSQTVTENDTVTLYCGANGRDNDGKLPRIRWLKDGGELELDASRHQVIGQGSLRITPVRYQDAGVYVCRASNSLDSTDADAQLNVQIRPYFINQPRSVTAYVNSDVRIDCEVSGWPKPRIRWLKDGDVIVESDYFRMKDDRTLEILGLLISDEGQYQCQAENEVGNIQAAAQLTILRKDERKLSTHGLRPALSRLDSSLVKDQQIPPPEGLAAALVSMRFVTLTWQVLGSKSQVDSITGFSVFWSEEDSKRERILNVTQMEANVQHLKPDTRYEFRVVSHSKIASSSPSTITVRTNGEVSVPSAVHDLHASEVGPRSARLVWRPPPEDIESYRVYYYKSADEEEQFIQVGKPSSLLEDLDEYTEYSIRIVAFNENGAGMATPEFAFTTRSDVPSTAPANVSVEALNSSTVIVRWEPPPREDQNGLITGYKVRYRERGEAGMTRTTDGGRWSLMIPNLQKGTEYQVRVQAININGSSPASSWTSVSTYANDLNEQEVPGQPTNLYVKPIGTSLALSWSNPKNSDILIRGFVIGYGVGFPDVFRAVVSANQFRHVLENLKPMTSYVVSVRAYNSRGEGRSIMDSQFTGEVEVAEPTTPMKMPVALRAMVLSSNTIVLTWEDSSLGRNQRIMDNRYYRIQYKPTKLNRKEKYVNSTDLICHINSLRPNTEYAFSVMVIKNKRRSLPSLSVVNTTLEDRPSTAPRSLKVTQLKRDSVQLTWQAPRNGNGVITGYLIYYTTDSTLKDTEWVVEGMTGSRMSAMVKELEPETTYYFKILARTRKGYGPLSPTVVYKTPGLDGHGGGQIVIPPHYGEKLPTLEAPYVNSDDKKSLLDPPMLYVIIGASAGILCLFTIIIAIILCKRRDKPSGPPANKPASPTVMKPQPPDLWIHDMEIKNAEKRNNVEGMMVVPPTPRNQQMYSDSNPPSDVEKSINYDSQGEERYIRASRNKPVLMIPVDQAPRDSLTSLTSHLTDPALVRPTYPRTQYTSPPRVHGGDYAASPVRPPHTSPYKKGQSVGVSHNSRGSPMPVISPKAPDVTLSSHLTNPHDLPKSYSAEELTAEMANLEGLMKDLNAITQQEFDC